DKVEPQSPLEALIGHLLDRRVFGHAGVADENVQPPGGLQSSWNERLEIRIALDVRLDGNRLAAAPRDQLHGLGQGPFVGGRRFEAAGSYDDGCAGSREAPRKGATDA